MWLQPAMRWMRALQPGQAFVFCVSHDWVHPFCSLLTFSISASHAATCCKAGQQHFSHTECFGLFLTMSRYLIVTGISRPLTTHSESVPTCAKGFPGATLH